MKPTMLSSAWLSPPGKGGEGGALFKSSGMRWVMRVFVLAVLVLAAFLLPGTGRATRLAGEYGTVPTAPPRPHVPVASSPSATMPPEGPAIAVPPVLETPSTLLASRPRETNTAANGSADVPSVSQSGVQQQPGRYVAIDFDNVDIQVFIKFVSELTGQNFVIDDKVKGKVTVFSPKKIAAEEVYKVFESVLEMNGFVAIPAGNMVTVIPAQDSRGKNEVSTYISLKYASAADMVKSLMAMFQQQAGKGVFAPIKIVADERANALVILATENDTARIRELVSLMDRMPPRGKGSIQVYYLQNAKAEDLAKVLTNLPQSKTTAATTTPTAAATTAPVFSKNIQIMADKATNSLLITSDPADYLVIEEVIKQMDIVRPMVYLESLIMEVNASKSFGIGVEWALTSSVTGSNVGVAGFKSSTSIIPQVDSTTSTISMPSGFAVGVVGAGITIGGVTFQNIGAVLQAYQNNSDVRILSTPQLLALDNEDAEITVGKNVPYVTRQDTTTTSTTNYSSYEYKDVGVILKVTPQINKDGGIRMKIDQSVTKLVSTSAALNTSGTTLALAPTTLKRTAKTTVSVKSGETVVIGGMIQDDSEYDSYKVPLLGDIPILGWLFKQKSSTAERTNLFIFITPRIIGKPEDAGKIKDEKREYMRTIQEGTEKNRP